MSQFAEPVSGVLHRMIRGGTMSADAIARLLVIRERTPRQATGMCTGELKRVQEAPAYFGNINWI